MPGTIPRPVKQLGEGLKQFVRLESSGGLLLMGAAVLAMIVANSPLASLYHEVHGTPLTVKFGDFGIDKPLLLWINDGLMAIFFLLVGLELKRETLRGHLSDLKKAALPAVAAIGGMAGPALLYVLFNQGDSEALKGWAIPAATDIAFALGVLSLLGKGVPTALKAFLLSVAIFDDVGAIVIIALFYTSRLSFDALLFGGVFVAGLASLSYFRVQRLVPYFLLGIPLWFAVLKSGVHATLAGVVLALFIPIGGDREEDSPLLRLEHALHPWVAYFVLPLFAFANAGVSVLDLSISDLTHPVPLGIVVGLFIGKQVGIFGLSWLTVRLRLAKLPEGVNWGLLYGVSLLAGIGFTMSLFIAGLAFEQGTTEFIGLERLGIILGSLLSGLVGYWVLRRQIGKPEAGGNIPL